MLTMIAAHAINFNCFCCHKNHLLKLRIFIISIITKLSYNFIRFNLSELVTTLTELNAIAAPARSEEHTSELQSRFDLVCRLLLEKKKVILDFIDDGVHVTLVIAGEDH